MKIEVDIEETTAEVLMENQGKWHKSCYLKFNSTKLLRAQRKRSLEPPVEQRRSKRHSSSTQILGPSCIFCDDVSGELHQCSTMTLDQELRRMAAEMQDTSLISRISGGDLIAIEARYHRNCLAVYKNRYRSINRASCSSTSRGKDTSSTGIC